MNSCLCITGLALWIFFAFVAIVIFGVVFLGCSYIDKVKENEKLTQDNKTLRYQLSKTQDKFYKATFKTPEVD